MECGFEKEASRIAALGHPARLKIIHELAHEKSCCVKNLVCRIDLAQSTISQHLKILLKAELVTLRTQGQLSWYEINKPVFAELADHMDQVFQKCCADCSQ